MSVVINEIYFIDPENFEVIEYNGKDYKKVEVDDIKKGALVCSRANFSDITYHTFKISMNTPESEIAAAVEIRMYEDMGLDINREYVIKYTKKEFSFDKTYQVDAFAILVDVLNEKFKNIVRRTKYIDYIAISRLSFVSLYQRGFIDKNRVDLFINIDKNESFAVIYKGGEFVSSISLPTLKSLQKKMEGTARLSAADINDYLTTQGFLEKAYKADEKKIFDLLQTTFIEIITKINNIILNSRGKFGIGGVNRVFIGVGGRRIPNINSIFELSGMFDMDIKTIDIIPEARKFDPLNAISIVHIYDSLRVEDSSQNLTIFHRKPPFFQTFVGKFLLLNLFLIPLAAFYPLYLTYQIYELEEQNVILNNKLTILKRETKKLKNELKNSSTLIGKLKEEKRELVAKQGGLNLTVKKLKKIKMSDEYSKMILEVIDVLKKYRLLTVKIEEIGKFKMSIEILSKSKDRETIGKFMKDLLLLGYKRSYTDEIRLKDNLYKSIIKIER